MQQKNINRKISYTTILLVHKLLSSQLIPEDWSFQISPGQIPTKKLQKFGIENDKMNFFTKRNWIQLTQ